MTFIELKTWFVNQLQDQYSEREATQILKSTIPLIHPQQRKWSTLVALNEDCETIQQKLIENKWLDRLIKGEPFAYVIGQAEFFGLNFKVDSTVLIPRPETEELVQWILDDFSNSNKLEVIDIGTGSGCIPISLAEQQSNWKLEGVDISNEALAIAEENAKTNKVDVQFSKLDILNYSLSKKYDIIVSNPPYIIDVEQTQMSTSTLKFEPYIALFTGTEDATIFYRRIGELGLQYLKENGVIYFELNEFFASEIKVLLEELGYQVELKKDLQGKFRMAKCRIQKN